MAQIEANPKVLEWARLERGHSIEEATALLKWPEDALLRQIEDGSAPVTIAQLRQIARAYRISFAALVMPEPLPLSKIPVEDRRLRTLAGAVPRVGPRTRLAFSEIEEFMEFFSELRASAPDLMPPQTLDSATLDEDPAVIAARQREDLGIGEAEEDGWETPYNAYIGWRQAIEHKGILVYQMKLNEPETRGISLLDSRNIPVILINGDDIAEARVFSLGHELAHIILRLSGISDQNEKDNVERWCNRFSAHLFMPRGQFLRAAGFKLGDGPREWKDIELDHLRDRFKVSRTAVLIQLGELGMAPQEYIYRRLHGWSAGQRRILRRSDPIRQRAIRFGSRHIDITFGALDRGLINYVDANDLLNLKPENFERLRQLVRERYTEHGD